jgi:hypothetical protein
MLVLKALRKSVLKEITADCIDYSDNKERLALARKTSNRANRKLILDKRSLKRYNSANWGSQRSYEGDCARFADRGVGGLTRCIDTHRDGSCNFAKGDW